MNKFTDRGLFKFAGLLYNLSSGIIKQMKLSQRKLTFIIFSALCIGSFAFFAIAQQNPRNDKSIFLDSDQDGLSDDEERTYGTDPNNRDTDGDSYSDGTEVKSGYDPLKRAPGDKIISDVEPASPADGQLTTNNLQQDGDKENLTQALSEDVAGLINEKMSANEEISIDDLNSIANKLTTEKINFDDLPEVNESEIIIKKQKYSKLSKSEREAKEKQDALEYLTAASYILASNSPQKLSESKDLENLFQTVVSQFETFSTSMEDTSYLKTLADKGEDALSQLKDIEVPQNMVEFHIMGIKIAKYAVQIRDEAVPASEDPIASIASFSKVQNLIFLTLELSQKISVKFLELGITEIPINL